MLDIYAVGNHGLRDLGTLGSARRSALVAAGVVKLNEAGWFPEELNLVGVDAGRFADVLDLNLHGDELRIVVY